MVDFAPAPRLLALSRSCLSQAGHSREAGGLVVPHRRCRGAGRVSRPFPQSGVPCLSLGESLGGSVMLPRPGRAAPQPGRRVPGPRAGGSLRPRPVPAAASRPLSQRRFSSPGGLAVSPHQHGDALPGAIKSSGSRTCRSVSTAPTPGPHPAPGLGPPSVPFPVPSRPADRGSSRSRAAGGDGLFL